MPDNKKHHFVPRFYLKRFSADLRSIHLYNLRIRRRISHASLKNQCYRDYFYGKGPALENAIATTEEGIAKILRSIDSSGAPPPFGTEDHFALIVHILMQFGRTRYSAEAANEMIDKLTKEAYGDYFRDKGIDLSHFTIGRKDAASYSLRMMASLYPLLMDLPCKLLINRTNEEFVTSDNPVVLYNQLMSFRQVGSNCGLASKGIQIFLPLDSRKLLVLFDHTSYRIGSDSKDVVDVTNPRDVYELNVLQVCSASENIYFSSPDFNATALHHKGLPHLRSGKVIVKGSEPQVTEEGHSRLVATSWEDVRTNLSVSFITLRKSVKKWRDEFRRLKAQPAVVIRNHELLRDFHEFEEACKRREYKPSEFIAFLNVRKNRRRTRER